MPAHLRHRVCCHPPPAAAVAPRPGVPAGVAAMFRSAAGLAALAVLAAGAGPARAGSLSVAFDGGTTNSTTAVAGFSTTGAMMDGMSVTAVFVGGGSQTVLWAGTGPASGGAAGAGWSLAEGGDTFGGDWVLSNTAAPGITRVLIDAGDGDAMFDIFFGRSEGTAGSGSGLTFGIASGGGAFDIRATYRDAIALGATAPVGDLFRRLDIAFTATAFGPGGTLVFRADTDSAQFAGDIVPQTAAPAPPAAALLGMGVLSLCGYGWRRRKASA